MLQLLWPTCLNVADGSRPAQWRGGPGWNGPGALAAEVTLTAASASTSSKLVWSLSCRKQQELPIRTSIDLFTEGRQDLGAEAGDVFQGAGRIARAFDHQHQVA